MLIFAYIFEEVGSPINIHFKGKAPPPSKSGYQGWFPFIGNEIF
jgi:hypothetical protein